MQSTSGLPIRADGRFLLFSYVYVLSFYDRAKDDPRYLEALRLLESKLDARGRLIVERPNRTRGGGSPWARKRRQSRMAWVSGLRKAWSFPS
jgi:hypothetical protein